MFREILKQANLVDYVWNQKNHTFDEYPVKFHPALYNPIVLVQRAFVGFYGAH